MTEQQESLDPNNAPDTTVDASSVFGIVFHFRKTVRDLAARLFRGQKKRAEDF